MKETTFEVILDYRSKETCNLHGERIKGIDKSNKTVECPVCGEKEDWDHVLLCEKTKMKEKNGKKI